VIRLPLLSGAEAQEAQQPPDQANEGAVRVLVVDDNADAAQMLATLLEAHGHVVGVEYDGTGGLARALRERPEVMLLDIGLPDMDGHELARRLRSSPDTANAMLIALTGYGQSEDRERARQAGFDRHLVKPADLSELLRILAEVRGHVH
jgi:CheY-like chemotaxis protein